MNESKTVIDMIHEAVEAISETNHDEPISYSQIIEWILGKDSERNQNSIRCDIICITVNVPSRVQFNNRKPRIIDHASRRDFLFSVGSGKVVKYDPERHGIWEIARDVDTRKLTVSEVITIPPKDNPSKNFALESHLRDYLAKNLGSLTIRSKKLELVKTEYMTGVGPIDILAKDEEGNLYVFELKCSRGTDQALGQILRYMGWLNFKEANGKNVYGIIVSERIDRKLKFAVKVVKDIDLLEYEVNFKLKTPTEIEL